MMTQTETSVSRVVLRGWRAIRCKFMYISPMLWIFSWFNMPGPRLLLGCALVLASLLPGCALVPESVRGPDQAQITSPAGSLTFAAQDKSQWREVKFPGKTATAYTPTSWSGQRWLLADARRSASMLSQKLDVDVQQHPRIRFEWWIEQGLSQADVALREREDSPARLILAFEGDRSEFSTRDASLSELSQLLTGEPMPYATLMYVWCPRRPIGSVVHNPRTDRIRKMVVATPAMSGALTIERDIAADYQQAFGKPPGRLIGIAIMTDSDNTQGQARTLYGPISIR